MVVAGGDGSVHEATNGIMRAAASAASGVIPTGTGNDFAKACDVHSTGNTRPHCWPIELPRVSNPQTLISAGCNDRYFANGAGFGFDAKVTRDRAFVSLPIGDLVYLLAIFRSMVDGIATPHMRSRPGK